MSCFLRRTLNLVYMKVVPILGLDSGQKARHTQRRRNRMYSLGVSVIVSGRWARSWFTKKAVFARGPC